MWDKPKEINNLNPFQYDVIGVYLPEMADIPDEFKRPNNKWCKLVSKLFFLGGELPSVKSGIDENLAYSNLNAILSSWQPLLEHKESGVAYLMSLWCEYPE